ALASAPIERPAEGTTWAQAHFVPLTKEAGADPEAQALVDAYDAKVSELNLAEAKTQPESCPAPRAGEPAFVGVNKCAACHEDAMGRFIKAEVSASWCMRCHEAANSPHFDYTRYKPFIIGPGHGEPLAKGEKPHPPPGGPLH